MILSPCQLQCFLHREIFVTIPKFCAAATLNLKSELSEMGMKDVFSRDADLSGITKIPVEVSKVRCVLSVLFFVLYLFYNVFHPETDFDGTLTILKCHRQNVSVIELHIWNVFFSF